MPARRISFAVAASSNLRPAPARQAPILCTTINPSSPRKASTPASLPHGPPHSVTRQASSTAARDWWCVQPRQKAKRVQAPPFLRRKEPEETLTQPHHPKPSCAKKRKREGAEAPSHAEIILSALYIPQRILRPGKCRSLRTLRTHPAAPARYRPGFGTGVPVPSR